MGTKKLMALGGVVLLAVYMGTRLAGPGGDGSALAGIGAGIEPRKGLLAVTTGAPAPETNRLILVDTVKKRLAVYRINFKDLGLIALRSYNYDMKIDDSTALDGQDFSYETIRDVVLKSGLAEEQKKAPPLGAEYVLTTDGPNGNQDANRIILVNPEEKRVVVYRLNGNQLLMVAARRFDEDFVPEFIPGIVPGVGLSRKAMVKAREQNEAGLKQE